MSNWTNCPNCGAVREPAESRCPYCGTPYPRDRKAAQAVAVPENVTIRLDVAQLAEISCDLLDCGLITPNEARRRMGLL